MNRVLAVRTDSLGDVLLTGAAIRALAAHADNVDLLVAPEGAAAAALLPGVDDVITHAVPWSGIVAPQADPAAIEHLIQGLRRRVYAAAVIFTSYHQSPLPAALVCRMADIPFIAGTSDIHPGSLLDVRHRRSADGRDDDGGPEGGHEVEAALDLAAAAGFALPEGDDRRLAIRSTAPIELPPGRYAVIHPGSTAPTRALPPTLVAETIAALAQDGWHVLLTGSPAETAPWRRCPGVTDLSGSTDLPTLASVLRGAAVVVVGNTGPAHLAAAVGTPVVSVFSPVVPAARWAPWGVPHVLLGDQTAACALSRARTCPVPGHPCVSSVTAGEVLAAIQQLTARSEAACAS
ncbi:glycosyltransferase family 9 protein [Calidifontibacter sp. DB0510]|uniref:Glycosyltransferase family 9 protein n=1 Tax=Metallococcus carri TaxID=1656884 RepID=A0A967E7Z0_9MICO|nr:glycosyltransferase family 9 protein [Metallococcus carri]NHN54662.1 glycosyltransferase family 9 protein [Metallococcus carri]NOP37007.1 glycosyltransferase family 9 protein [Calidifontibacter sp. DB2511S]